jgi:hypothetical protein
VHVVRDSTTGNRQSDFVKTSKNGAFSLRLLEQDENVSQPEFRSGNAIDGIVEVSKPGGVSSVEVKVSPAASISHFLGPAAFILTRSKENWS